MKRRKWLIYIFLFLLILNLAFYFLVRVANIDNYVRNRISDYLSILLKAQVDIEILTFNDKQINISGLKVRSDKNDFDLNLGQVYIDYDLLKLIFKRFGQDRPIKSIIIQDSEFIINLPFSDEKDEDTENKKTDFYKYTAFFKRIELNNSSFRINYKNRNIEFSEFVDSLKFSLNCDEIISAELSGKIARMGNIKVIAQLDKDNAPIINAEIKGYSNNDFPFSDKLDSLSYILDANITYVCDSLSYAGNISDLSLSKDSHSLTCDSFTFKGDLKELKTNSKNLIVDDSSVNLIMNLNSPFSANARIDAKININEIELSRYFPKLQGITECDLKVSGLLNDPKVNFSLNSGKLSYLNEIFLNTSVSGTYHRENINFKLNRATWQSNEIIAEGNYNFKNGLDAHVVSEQFAYNVTGVNFDASLEAYVKYDKEPDIKISAEKLNVIYKNIEMRDLNVKGKLTGNNYHYEINKEALIITGNGDISNKNHSLIINISSLNPSSIFIGDNATYTWLPWISGNIEVELSHEKLDVESKLRVFDKKFGYLDGWILSSINADIKKNTLKISNRTKSAKYKLEPISFRIDAEGTFDSLHTTHLEINKNLYGDLWLELKPDFNWGGHLESRNTQIKDYLRYFIPYYELQKTGGKIDLTMKYDSRNKGKFSASLTANKIRYSPFENISFAMEAYGSNNMITVAPFSLTKEGKAFANISGKFYVQGTDYDLEIDVPDAEMDEFFPESGVKGLINCKAWISKIYGKTIAELKLNCKNLSRGNLSVDTLIVDVRQDNNLFNIKNIYIKKEKRFNFEATGYLGYNFISGDKFYSDSTLTVKLSGDPLRVINELTGVLHGTRSSAKAEFTFNTDDDGFNLISGNFVLNSGEFQIITQPDKIDNVIAEIGFKDNQMIIQQLSVNQEDGQISIINKIDDDDYDFRIGKLNLGKMYVKTNQEGVRVHVPSYMPPGTSAKAVVKGQYSDMAEVRGPFDDIKISALFEIYSGKGIYPSDTKNIITLLGEIGKNDSEEKDQDQFDDDEYNFLPFEFDFYLKFMENCRYVTYPVNILAEEGSYLILNYNPDENWTVPDARFSGYEGSLDLFGTTFKLDNASVIVSKYFEEPYIEGRFTKTTYDGTEVYLDVFSLVEGFDENQKSHIQFDLRSDNSDDKTMSQILARLHYNRNSSEISDPQMQELLQDDVVQMAGFGLNSTLIDPLISPVENGLRKILHLDFLSIETGWVQNLFNKYYDSETQNYYSNEEIEAVPNKQNAIWEASTDFILNNLNLNMGKYISNRTLLNYEMNLQKAVDIDSKTVLLSYHNFSVRYRLVYNLKLVAEYNITPDKHDNSYGIFLEKSFKFW